ncbi:MAG: pyridoxal-phosphate dependent enzyme [Gemmatimonadetes bacterium]|nr:pyridoxal-phosphate dependent enzyme [Gemmatimonadota bacterium]
MRGPGLREIYDARRRIAGVARRTPLDRSCWLSQRAGSDVYLKLECWQRTRSFKIRGAYNAIASLDRAARARGLVAASAGNHGQGVALAARQLGARATIFVPESAPHTKQERIRAFGGELRTVAGTFDDAEAAATEFAAATGARFIPASSDPAVVAGQGTIGLEILEDLPAVQEVIVPVGGGGLIAGIGTALKAGAADVRVVGVQSDRTPAMHAAFQAGGVVEAPGGPTLADGLAGGVDEVSYAWARAVTDELLLVEESAIPGAIRTLYGYDSVVAEGAGAVGVAALCGGLLELKGPAVIVVSGGNLDAERLAAILGPG